MPRPRRNRIETFWERANPEPNSGCWLWSGHLDRNGYSRLSVETGKQVFAHRWAYEKFRGPIPAGMVLDHLCRVPSCVNPDHLEIVTIGENVRRGNAGLHHRIKMKAKTHCPQGHPYTPENMYVYGPRRHCKTCIREHSKRYYAKRASAA